MATTAHSSGKSFSLQEQVWIGRVPMVKRHQLKGLRRFRVSGHHSSERHGHWISDTINPQKQELSSFRRFRPCHPGSPLGKPHALTSSFVTPNPSTASTQGTCASSPPSPKNVSCTNVAWTLKTTCDRRKPLEKLSGASGITFSRGTLPRTFGVNTQPYIKGGTNCPLSVEWNVLSP